MSNKNLDIKTLKQNLKDLLDITHELSNTFKINNESHMKIFNECHQCKKKINEVDHSFSRSFN